MCSLFLCFSFSVDLKKNVFFSTCACTCAILMYSFQSHLFFFSFLPLVSQPSYLYIFCCLYSVEFFSFVFLQYYARIYIYINIYLCLVSTLEWYFVFLKTIVFLITEFVQCSFIICLCAVSFIFSFFFPLFSFTNHTDRTMTTTKNIDSFWCVCVCVYECISI